MKINELFLIQFFFIKYVLKKLILCFVKTDKN